jgi:malate/lactate dehydrogenase
MSKVLIIGLGSLGGHMLEFLARSHGPTEIVAADVDEQRGLQKTNNVILGAANMAFYPRMKFLKMNLNDIDGTGAILRNEQPDVVVNSTTLQSWWVIGAQLREDAYLRLLDAGLGPWTPMHLTLTYKLMQAVRKSGIKTHVVSTSFPDAVNCILSKVGLAPTVGVGNFDLLVPRVKKAVSDKLGIPMSNVTVFMLGYHYHDVRVEEFGTTGGAPYFLRILVGDRDVNEEVNAEQMLLTPIPTPPLTGSDPQVASSAVKNVLAIVNDTRELTHAPGPQGLPGGYPVRLSAKGAEVVVPTGLTLKEAIHINEEAQKYDGIERIEDDGSVVLTEKAHRIMIEMLHYERKRFSISESEAAAKELRQLYNDFAAKNSKT